MLGKWLYIVVARSSRSTSAIYAIGSMLNNLYERLAWEHVKLQRLSDYFEKICQSWWHRRWKNEALGCYGLLRNNKGSGDVGEEFIQRHSLGRMVDELPVKLSDR